MAHFSTFWTVNDHFWSLGNHGWKSSFLVPDQSLGVQNDQLGRAEKMGKKKFDNFFSKGRILARKTAHFSTFRTVNDQFLIDRRSSLEILVFSPWSKFGGAKRQARTGREDRQKKFDNFFSKGRIFAYKTAHFSTFRTVNDHFWSLGDHRWKSSFLVPDQS